MNTLEIAIKNAIESKGQSLEVNKAYLELMKANFIIPIEKNTRDGEPIVLFLSENEEIYIPVFSSDNYLDNWANDIREEIQILKLSGIDLLLGIGDNVFITLNPGSDIHKTFNPMEIARLKNMVSKLFKNKS